MIVYRKLRLGAAEDFCGLLGSGVIAADSFELLRALCSATGSCCELVDEQVDATGMTDQIFIESGVAASPEWRRVHPTSGSP